MKHHPLLSLLFSSLILSNLGAQDTATAKPDPRVVLKKATDDLIASGLAEKAMKQGATAPDFSLPNANGKLVKLSELLKSGPVVLAFYRGGWCPYCNKQLASYQAALPEMKQLGATLVAVTPQKPDRSLTQIEKANLEFEVLSDNGLKVARQFGLVFTMPPDTRPIYQGFGIDLEAWNGNASWELPMPGTYIIGKDRVIKYAFVKADYSQRAEASALIDALKTMKAMKAN
jgi:peroxiredoxin